MGIGRHPSARKFFVKVRADHEIGGRILPIKFREAGGAVCIIERILGVSPTRRGAKGFKYTCQVGGREIDLFYDRGLWYVEAEEPRPSFPPPRGEGRSSR